MRRVLVLSAVAALSSLGCDTSTPATDAGSDAPVAADAGGDSGATDAPAPADAGTDANAGADAGAVDAGGDAGSASRSYTIRFRAEVDGEDFACGTTYDGLGPSADRSVTLTDFRFYVHQVELLAADGSATPLAITDDGTFQADGVALLDFENGGPCTMGTTETHTAITGTAPEGTYTGIRFVLGIPFALNHQDASAAHAPFNFTSMFWNWQGGYKFVRIDAVNVVPGGGGSLFAVHLGSTGCDGSPAGGVTMCDRPNRSTIELTGFDPETSVVVADFAELMEGVDPTINTAATAPGCMSGATDPECNEVIPSFGIPFGAQPAAMDFFSVSAP